MVTKTKKSYRKSKFIKYTGKIYRVTPSQYKKIRQIRLRTKKRIGEQIKKILRSS